MIIKGVLKYISNPQNLAKKGIEKDKVLQNTIDIIVQEVQWEAEETPNTWSPIQSFSTFSFTIIGIKIAKTEILANMK